RTDSVEKADGYMRAAFKFLDSVGCDPSIHAPALASQAAAAARTLNETAQLFECTGRLYEASALHAPAALAYKCAAIARTRALAALRSASKRERQDLLMLADSHPQPQQPAAAALPSSDHQGVRAGASPASSTASDVDNASATLRHSHHHHHHHHHTPLSTSNLTAPASSPSPSPAPGTAAAIAGAGGGVGGASCVCIPDRLVPSLRRVLKEGNDMASIMDTWGKAAAAAAHAMQHADVSAAALMKLHAVGDCAGMLPGDAVWRAALDAFASIRP
ncbi:unnamed protein product, partial [Closterium sp. NIES-54]